MDPVPVTRIAFTEWTRDGLLRHPRFPRLRNRPRDDERADGVVRERPRRVAG